MFPEVTIKQNCRTDYFYLQPPDLRHISHTSSTCESNMPVSYYVTPNYDTITIIAGVFVFLLTFAVIINITKVKLGQ